MSSSKNDLTQSLLAECRRKDERIEELENQVKIYNNFLIDLHTANWTGNMVKVKELLLKVGRYSYARTNRTGDEKQEERQQKETLLNLDK